MGKKKDAKKAGKLPKRIAGMKLPKEARRIGETLIAQANSPEVHRMLAAGLSMAATVASNAAERQRRSAGAADAAMAPVTPASPAQPVPPVPPAPPANDAAPTRPGEAGIRDPQAMAEAIGSIAETALNRLFGARKDGAA